MSCPYFRESYFALCARSNSAYVPSIAEMEQYCFKDEFYFCPVIKASLAKNEISRSDSLSFRRISSRNMDHYIRL